MQHRPFGAGEDRNVIWKRVVGGESAAQHRPFGAGEDRNTEWGDSLGGNPAPWQHRPFGAGEDRNIYRYPGLCGP